jgi:hypothetical protein
VWQAGENNARVQSAAVETLLQLASVKDAALSSLASLFLKPEKRSQWKRVLGRLVALSAHYLPTCCFAQHGTVQGKHYPIERSAAVDVGLERSTALSWQLVRGFQNEKCSLTFCSSGILTACFPVGNCLRTTERQSWATFLAALVKTLH